MMNVSLSYLSPSHISLSCGSTFPKFWVVPPFPLDLGLSSPLVSYPPFPSHVLVWLDPLEMAVIS